MRYFIFSLLCVLCTACATTSPSTSNSSYVVIPENNFGENYAPIRFTSASRAVDLVESLFFTASEGSIGKFQYNLSDSEYSNFTNIIVKYNDTKTNYPYTLCALINGKNVLPICKNGIAIFNARPYLWQGDNTIILHGFNNIIDVKLKGLDQEIPLPLDQWKCEKDLAGITYEWFKPELERKSHLPFWETVAYISFYKQAIPPTATPQWVDVELNSARPLLFACGTDSTKLQPYFQERMNNEMVSSRMLLTSLAVWYKIEFEMPNTNAARQAHWIIDFEKIGAGAAFLNGKIISEFGLQPGAHEFELKNICYGARNTLVFCLLPTHKSKTTPESGAILEAVELRQK